MSIRLELQPWDSTFFGRVIGRLHANEFEEGARASIEGWCRLHQVDCLYWLAPSTRVGLHQRAHDLGFCCMDLRVELRRRLPFDSHAILDGRIRTGSIADLGALVPIARVVHRDSRFAMDRNLQHRAADLFERWIVRDLDRVDGIVLVADVGTGACGYCSCHLKSQGTGEGVVSLVGVDPSRAGQGLGRGLIAAALDWFRLAGCREVQVVTQGVNVAAQRLYQSMGFRTHEVGTWFHRWTTDSLEKPT